MSHTAPARSHVGDVTAAERLKQFPKDYYIDHGMLMCLACEKAVDFQRKSSVTSHLKSDKHKQQQQKRKRAEEAKVRTWNNFFCRPIIESYTFVATIVLIKLRLTVN